MIRTTQLVTVIGTTMLVNSVAAGTGLAQTGRLDTAGNIREEAYIRLPL